MKTLEALRGFAAFAVVALIPTLTGCGDDVAMSASGTATDSDSGATTDSESSDGTTAGPGTQSGSDPSGTDSDSDSDATTTGVDPTETTETTTDPTDATTEDPPDCVDNDSDGHGNGPDCAPGFDFDCDDDDPNINPDAQEECDGVDNNCDGATDENCACDTNDEVPCYGGPPDTIDVGVCHGGVQKCEGGVFTDCQDQVTPGDEACNNLDDNCDGGVDEGVLNVCGWCPGENEDQGCFDEDVCNADLDGLECDPDDGATLGESTVELNNLWAPNTDNNTLSKYNMETGELLGTYPVGSSPSRTTIDLEFDAWVACRNSANVYQVHATDCDGNACVDPPIPVGSGPRAVVTDKDSYTRANARGPPNS